MKVLVCGGRDFKDEDFLWSELDLISSEELIEMVIQGEALGADSIAKAWAAYHKIPCLSVPADWDKHGKRAGYLRNALMLTFNPDRVLAMPGGKGTEMMCALAESKSIPVTQWRK